jgi:hypothetical protein
MRWILLPLLLAGCAPSLVQGNEAGGIVNVQILTGRQSGGMKIADTECAKYGKVARYKGINEVESTLSYDCVDR